MIITGYRPRKFYRLGARTGNRDIIRHEGEWIIISGKILPHGLLDALGDAIEKEEEKGVYKV